MDPFELHSFNSFLMEHYAPLFEASTLSKTGMPKGMIAAIHKKAEHWEKYPRMAHTYRGGAAIPMPYKYHSPAHDIEISEPKLLTGEKTNVDPYSGRTIGSRYTDFHWFIESLPLGENRVLISNPDLEFYMYIYNKSRSKGATGLQYAILWWDKDRQKAVDFGYSELTTQAVDRSRIRSVHDTKGGNRSDKIQEFVRSATKDGDRTYAPSPTKPLYAYKLEVDVTGTAEPRAIRKGRMGGKEPVLSTDFISVFADKYKGLIEMAKPETRERLIKEVNNLVTYYRVSSPVPDGVTAMAEMLGVDPHMLHTLFFTKFRDFRKELYSIGAGSYMKTSGFDLEAENAPVSSYATRYEVSKKKFSPDEEKAQPEQGFREAQPEKYKRDLPVSGEYASIPSIIKNHTLDGALHRFFYYIITGKITAPKVNVLALLGIDPEKEDFTGLPDFETWIL
jgi:hypothetical protein